MKAIATLTAACAILLAGCSAQSEDAGHDDHAGMDHSGMDHSGMDHSEMDHSISEEQAALKREGTAELVSRFEADACSEADFVGQLRSTQADGAVRLVRAFGISDACAEALSTSAANLGFFEGEPGVFVGGPFDGAMEKLAITADDDGSGSVLEWEVNTP